MAENGETLPPVDVLAEHFAQAWCEHPTHTRVDAELAVAALSEAGWRIVRADTFILDEVQEAPSAFPPPDWEADQSGRLRHWSEAEHDAECANPGCPGYEFHRVVRP